MAKTNTIPATINRYRVPARLISETADALRTTGKGMREAVALWQGKIQDERHAEVTKLIIPQQITGPLHFNVPLPERLRILGEISKVGEFILIQLHTHPREAFHSAPDDRYAITKHLNAVSIVIPDFGMHWDGNFQHTSVNVNLGAGTWRELSAAEVQSLFEVIA